MPGSTENLANFAKWRLRGSLDENDGTLKVATLKVLNVRVCGFFFLVSRQEKLVNDIKSTVPVPVFDYFHFLAFVFVGLYSCSS